MTNPDQRANLWATLRSYIVSLFSLFGGPENVAALGAIGARERKQMLSWLQPLEEMLRKLIYVDAVALVPSLAPIAPRTGARKPRTRRFIEQNPDAPETWRVSFRVSSRVDGGGSSRTGGLRPRLFSAWPIAERYEALLRGFNDPAPLARRLARLLRRKPASRKTFVTDKARASDQPCYETLPQVTALARAAPFPNSS